MNFKKIISAFMAFVITTIFMPICHVAYAQEDDELLDLFSKYYENNRIVEVTCNGKSGNNPVYYDYNFYEKPADFCEIDFSTDTEIEIDFDEITKNINYNSDMFSMYTYFSNPKRSQTVHIDFNSFEHETNYNIAREVNEILEEKYNILSSFVYLDAKTISNNEKIVWSKFRKKDESGYWFSTEEDLTKKQIEKIKTEITANNFSAKINDDGKITFNENASEIEKFRFALWFKEEYGFTVGTTGYYENIIEGLPQYSTIEIMHLAGDINGNNEINISDAVIMNKFLFSCDESEIADFNMKNADLCKDGVIDIFDFVMLKKMLVA